MTNIEKLPTTRAYTIRLSGDGDWRDALWDTHITVNRAAQVWGDWLLTLRGGLPASLAAEKPDRRVLLALSWLSVKSPASLAPQGEGNIIARRTDSADEPSQKVTDRLRLILSCLNIGDTQEWMQSCESAISARIRDDVVWVDRSQCFAELQKRFPGITHQWAAARLFGFLGDADEYFKLPDEEAGTPVEPKDFSQKAGGWLSCNWGACKKSDAGGIDLHLAKLAGINPSSLVGKTGKESLCTLLESLGQIPLEAADVHALYKQLKGAIGWKGRSSKGAIALKKIRDTENISDGNSIVFGIDLGKNREIVYVYGLCKRT